MAGYVDKQIAAYQKRMADAIAGKGLKAAVKQLQDKSQIKNTLKDLPARGAITAKRQIGKRVGAASTTTAYSETSRTFHTELRELRSASAVFVVQYYNVRTTTMIDNLGRVVPFNYLDYDPDA